MAIINLYNQKKWHYDWTLILFWLASLLILLLSFHQQYFAKIEPCSLCQWQRYVYFLIFSLSPIGLIQSYNLSVRYALILIFLMGLCLATYHILVQWEWLADRCTMTQKIENMTDFMKMLEQPRTSCAIIDWKLFGLSASFYNAIFSVLAILCLNTKITERLGLCLKDLLIRKLRQQKRS